MTSDSALRRYSGNWAVSRGGADRRECAGCNRVTPPLSAGPTPQLRQPGDAGGHAPGLVAGEQLGRRSPSRLVLEIEVGERLPPSALNRLRPYPKDMSAIDPLAVRSLERLAFDPNISFQLVTFVLPALPW